MLFDVNFPSRISKKIIVHKSSSTFNIDSIIQKLIEENLFIENYLWISNNFGKVHENEYPFYHKEFDFHQQNPLYHFFSIINSISFHSKTDVFSKGNLI
jgi:hypothetical protein